MENLKNPNALMRPAPFWSWNDKLDESECRRQIREMTNKGWGSFFMHSRVGLVTPYLSEEWMNLIKACAEEAGKNGIYAWLYDEDKWPSGYAGGVVPVEKEEYRSRYLILLKKDQIQANDTVLKEFTLSGATYFVCKRIDNLDNPWFNGYSYVDLMNPEAVKAFLASTHEKYKEAVGEYFGNVIPGIFTDEPCYVFANAAENAPWSEYLPDFFKKMKDYDITDHVHKIFFDIEDYQKIRFDYYEVATALFKESFTKQYYDWCDKNNLLLTGHFMSEDFCYYQTQWSGDVMSHYEFMHWPGTDKLGRNIVQNITNKQCSSVCDQLGKERAFSEVFGCVGGQVSFFERKWIGDWQTILGINFVNHHLSLYSMRGERKRDYPANLFYQQPWWDEEKTLSDYFARICAFASEGKRDLNILLLQPLSSVWSEYSPIHSVDGFSKEMVYDRPFETYVKALMELKLDYHIGNENIMKNHAKIYGNKLAVGEYEYDYVVIPPMSNMMKSTYDLLKEYSKNGGKLLFSDRLPYMIEGVKTDVSFDNFEIGRGIGDCLGKVSSFYKNRPVVIDKISNGNAASIWLHTRKTKDSTRYFFANTNKDREVKSTIKLPKAKYVYIMDLCDGEIYETSPNMDSDFAEIDIVFAGAGSVLFICTDNPISANKDCPVVLGSGVMTKDFTKIIPVDVVNDFNCQILNDNTLLLNNFKLNIDGFEPYEGPVCNSWHSIFYNAKEGAKFTAEYSFLSEIDLKDAYAAIEVAENNDDILFNGEKVTALKTKGEMGEFDHQKSYLDINFTKVPIRIRKGLNTLIIKGRKINNITGPGFHIKVDTPMAKYFPTEAEEVYICGNFSLKKLSDSVYSIAEPNTVQGHNITNEGYPFYIGKIKIDGKFNVGNLNKETVLMKLINANKSSAVLKINGLDCGICNWAPDMFDISKAVKEKENTFELIFATNLVNCFGPNRISYIKKIDGIGPGSFIDMNGFQEKYELFDFGIEQISVYKV